MVAWADSDNASIAGCAHIFITEQYGCAFRLYLILEGGMP